jgi:hypothetical protein
MASSDSQGDFIEKVFLQDVSLGDPDAVVCAAGLASRTSTNDNAGLRIIQVINNYVT